MFEKFWNMAVFYAVIDFCTRWLNPQVGMNSNTIITLSIGTDRPLQNSVDPDQMSQRGASDQVYTLFAIHTAIF